MKAKTTDVMAEKHVPVVRRVSPYAICVEVGETPHPMLSDHYIHFVALQTKQGIQVKYLHPDEEAKAYFSDCCEEPIAVYEYCNLHGLWKTTTIPEGEKQVKCQTLTETCKKKKSKGCALLLLLGIVFPFLGCSAKSRVDNSTIQQLDLQRYLGLWYELARFDHKFERGMHNCTAMYEMRNDGKIRVVNAGLRDGERKVSEGKAKTTSTTGLLRVSFFGPFYSDYRIMMLSEDYSYALVGSGSEDYLWVLSRTPVLPDGTIRQIQQEAVRRGYDLSKLIWVDQSLSTDTEPAEKSECMQ